MDFSKIKNIIFDLGAVIINIDIQITFQAFAERIGQPVDKIISQFHNDNFWNDYETGKVKDNDFRKYVKDNLSSGLSDDEIDYLWNKLLLDLPLERLTLLEQLKSKYRLFLLSNTNYIHIKQVNKILSQITPQKDISAYFEKVYYSYEMGLRKPDVEIYKEVLIDSKLNPEETLFLDDNYDNILGAQKAGIQSIHVTPPHTILELLAEA